MGIVTGKDFDGELKFTFFPKVWEKLESFIEEDKVLAFKGKVTHSEQYGNSFQVEELLDINNLQEQSVKSIHIRLFPTQNKRSSMELRDFLVAHSGNCSVYLHIERDEKNYTMVSSDTPILESWHEDAVSSEKSMKDITHASKVMMYLLNATAESGIDFLWKTTENGSMLIQKLFNLFP